MLRDDLNLTKNVKHGVPVCYHKKAYSKKL